MDTRRRRRHHRRTTPADFFEGWQFKSWGEAIATLAIMIVTCALVMAFMVWAFTTAHNAPYEYSDTTTYWVEPGDTLWKIAREYSTEGQDVRRVIDIIEELNDCTATIYPGQNLTVPVFYK